MTLKKTLLNPLTIIIPVIAFSFLMATNADAQYRKHYPKYHSGFSYGGYGYGGYGYGGYAPRYTPKTYRVAVLYGKSWVTKYYGTCSRTAYNSACYYRSKGLCVRY